MKLLKTIRDWYYTNKLNRAIGAAAIAASPATIDAIAEETNQPPAQIEVVEKTQPKLTGCVNVKFASDYITDAGTKIGKGPVLQDYAAATIDHKGFGLTLANWSDYSLKTKGFDEVDGKIALSVPLLKNIGTTVDYRHWEYPDLGWKANDVVNLILSYQGPVSASLKLQHLFSNGKNEDGNLACLKLSKDLIQIPIDNWKLGLGTGLSTAFLDNYFGNSGITQVTPSAAITAKKGNICLEAGVNRQFGTKENIETRTDYSVGAGINF